MASILKLFCFIFLYPDKLIGNPDKLIGNPDKLIGRGLIVAKVETSIPPFIWQRFHQVTDCFPGDMFPRRHVSQATCLPGDMFTRRQISFKKWIRNYGFFTGSFLGFIFYCKFAGYKNINFGGTNNENQKS